MTRGQSRISGPRSAALAWFYIVDIKIFYPMSMGKRWARKGGREAADDRQRRLPMAIDCTTKSRRGAPGRFSRRPALR
jgi:hypothetical protein